MYNPQIRLIAQGKGNPIMSVLLSIKNSFRESVNLVINEPNASLVNAIIVGERHSVPQDILNMLRTVGIIHIVILSGYAITIIAESVRKFFSRFGFRTSLILASVSIILFALMTGASAMVARASIMALLAFLSKALSRKHDVVRALALTLFLMVLWNPMILVFDVSFQVSMLAVAGLIFISPIFENKFDKFPDKFGFKNIFISTLSAQVAVLPYLLYVTGSLSLFSVTANILVLPILPMTMLFGLLAGVFGFISSILAFPFSAIAYILTSYELFIAKIFSAIPFSSVVIPMPFWIVILIYITIIFWVFKTNKVSKNF
jgi:competence protein ComEC